MKQINHDIETNEFKSFYLLFGAEDYLKLQYRDKLVKALADPEDTMNYCHFQGDKINVSEILDIGDTLPFFAEKRVLVIEDSGLFKKTPEDFDKRLESFPDTTVVVFVEKEIDKRCRLYKWMGKHGYCCELGHPDEKMLVTWIKGMCKAERKQIEDGTIFYLVEHMGTDMMLLKNEMEKLFSYCIKNDVITIDDVRSVCISQATDKMFDMLDAIGNRNQEKALQLYHDLLVLREPAMKILYMLVRHYRILMEMNALLSEGKDNKTIASACGIPPFSVKKYAAQAKAFSYERLTDMVEACQLTDEYIKTGRVQDIVGVELLIVEFSNRE